MSDEMSPWQVTSVRGCGTLEVSEYDFRGIRGCVISFETEVGPVSFDRQGAENRVSLCDRNRHNASKTAEKEPIRLMPWENSSVARLSVLAEWLNFMVQ